MTTMQLPEVTPTYVDPKARYATRQSQAMLEEITFLRGYNMTWERIADRLGVKINTIYKTIRQARESGIVIE